MKMSNVLEGVGAALLLLLPYYFKFLLPTNAGLYHFHLPVTNLIGGLLVDLFCYSILVAGFLTAIQYLGQSSKRVLESLFAGFIVWNLVDCAIHELINMTGQLAHSRQVWYLSVMPMLLLLAGLAYFLPRMTEPIVRTTRLGLVAFSFCALWIVPELLHVATIREPIKIAPPFHPSAAANETFNRRIVWILFDELSYHQVFDHPVPGLELPNFSRMRAESVSFAALKPVGFYTDRIIPSLLINKHIDHIRTTIDGKLLYKDDLQGDWATYDPNATLFGLAQRNGQNAGVDGWFIPYCRIFAQVLNSCSWEPNMMEFGAYGASEKKSLLANALVLPSHLLEFDSAAQASTVSDDHMLAYRKIMDHTHALIGDNRLRLVFLHIPVPHMPGIYDRQTHRFRRGGTYLDNLVLADDTLGALLQEIQSSSSAAKITVIVSSDHSWRVTPVRHAKPWIGEEEQASSGGVFDDRPVLLIHFPDQNIGNDVNAPTSEMVEHDIVAGMILGEINSAQDLRAFLSQRGL